MPSIRMLTAVPICDGHDSAINTINLELIRRGIEVIYLGYHRSAKDIVRAAIQEDVVAIGLSSYNGGHIEFFEEVVDRLETARLHPRIRVFGGGGGTITHEDAEIMYKHGIDRIFFAGTPLEEITRYIETEYGNVSQAAYASGAVNADQTLARDLTLVENGHDQAVPGKNAGRSPKVIGFTGPGGAGKTTVIDELVLRFLRSTPVGKRLAILSHDPSIVSSGALLGDRATMIYSQNDRVFMRSMATRGTAGGLSSSTERALQALSKSGLFEFILVETVGIGQEAVPFGIRKSLADHVILVLPPDYGSRVQLQKIAMLDVADVIVVNKSDLRGVRTAIAEIEARIRGNQKKQILMRTQANKHRDQGVDQLFNFLFAGPGTIAID
jgi:methylmalonyl-CoA mutase cobalamin-binding domain/chain